MYTQKITVSTKHGNENKTLIIRPPGEVDVRKLAAFINSALDAKEYLKGVQGYERGMALTPMQVCCRLACDPESILVAVLDGKAVAYINIVKRRLNSEAEIPATNRDLTSSETYLATRPDDGNYWFCPLVGVPEKVRKLEYRAELPGIGAVPLAPIMVYAVKQMARERGVERLFANSRPFGLRRWIESNYAQLDFSLGSDCLLPQVMGFLLEMDETGVRAPELLAGAYLVRIERYWNMRLRERQWMDSAAYLHGVLGGEYRRAFPHGHVVDWNSLGYRVLVEHPLDVE